MKIKVVILFILLISFPLRGQRIVSLAPALTELAAEFGLIDHFVGRTRFCDFPPEVQRVPAVGGVLDLNFEFIYQLRPDFILCYQEQVNQLKALEKISKIIVFKHQKLVDLEETVSFMGRAFGLEKKAQMIISGIREKISRVQRQAINSKEKRILFIVSREGGDFKNLIAVGNGDFLSELIKICGAKNAYQGKIAYPSLSLEAILALQPDLLIEFYYQEKGRLSQEEVVAQWQNQLMKFGRQKFLVKVVSDPVLLRLGPRIGIAAEQLLRVIHGK